MKYNEAIGEGARLPIDVFDVPASVWAQTWTERPTVTIRLGLRSLAEQTLSEVTGAAMVRANRCHPQGGEHDRLWADEYNRAVVAYAVGRSLCSPDSADVPWHDYPDMVALTSMTPEGAAWLYARLTAATAKASPLAAIESPISLLVGITERWHDVGALSDTRKAQLANLLRAALDIIEGR